MAVFIHRVDMISVKDFTRVLSCEVSPLRGPPLVVHRVARPGRARFSCGGSGLAELSWRPNSFWQDVRD